MRRCYLLLAAVWLSLAITTPAHAIIVSATERLYDDLPFDFLNRNLERGRSNSLGYSALESLDSTITTDNAIDDDFGIYNGATVTYRHDLTWLNPSATTYLTGNLTIQAYGVDNGLRGHNDSVFVESINFGTLTPDGLPVLEGFTTSIFAFNDQAQLNFLLLDGYLNITVNKIAALDLVSVYESTLTVRYEAVPEPATLLLLGSSIAAIAFARRRLRA